MKVTPRPTYGWDRADPPLARIASGDEIELELRDASDGQVTRSSGVESIDQFDRNRGNPLTGPIFVDSSRPGQVLQLDILDVAVGEWGWTAIVPGFGLLGDDFREPHLLHWSIHDGRAEALGFRLAIRPFPGVLGTTPAASGRHSVVPPRRVGGNMDTKQLCTGSSLFLPVEVVGAMLGVGDGHALQGDGEVCGSGLETTMSVRLRVAARDDLSVAAPEWRSPTADAFIGPVHATTGIGPDLYVAAQDSVRRMVDFVSGRYEIAHADAYMLCSVIADLRISEVVDQPNWVVSTLLPIGALDSDA